MLPARGVKSELARALPEALAAVFAAIGVAEADAKRELAEMREHVVGKTASRTVLGSMNDFAVAVEYAIRGSGRSDPARSCTVSGRDAVQSSRVRAADGRGEETA